MRRRDLILGAGCVAALAGAEALRPRQLLSLAGDRRLEQIIPERFGAWTAVSGGAIVVPETPGSLANTLYSDTVGRTYHTTGGGAPVMLLAAHGDSQSDLLQLHRPESCYKAVGFSIVQRLAMPVPLAPGVMMPAVALAAHSVDRNEDVLYWTRLGEYLPTTAGEQRMDRLRTAMSGLIADGVLVRASLIREGDAPDWARLTGVMAQLVRSVTPNARAALIGTALATDMRAADA